MSIARRTFLAFSGGAAGIVASSQTQTAPGAASSIGRRIAHLHAVEPLSPRSACLLSVERDAFSFPN
jgi:hypothetical protein